MPWVLRYTESGDVIAFAPAIENIVNVEGLSFAVDDIREVAWTSAGSREDAESELQRAKRAAKQSLAAWETETTLAGITIEGVTLRADVDSASKYAVEIQTALAFSQNPLISDNSGRLVEVPADKAPSWVMQYRTVFNARRKLVQQAGDAIDDATTTAEVAAALALLGV